MAARRALVATDAGAVREILGDGESGSLVPPGAVAPLAEAIVKLLQDRPERERLIEAGWRRVRECFSVQQHARRIEQVYEEILEQSRPACRAGRGAGRETRAERRES
jgi:glycosyltransferase involved in cell wall biosynthesis